MRRHERRRRRRHQHRELGFGIVAAQRRQQRRRQDHVAQEGGLDEQDAFAAGGAGGAWIVGGPASDTAVPRAGTPVGSGAQPRSGFASSISITGMSSMIGYSTRQAAQ